jgi:flagellar biosynthesis/type III secretory pathway M-ring protein FliF/YscJ
MRYLQKLPLMFALAAAFLIGIIGSIRQNSQKTVLAQMVMVMVLFFFIGLFARATLLNIKEQHEKREKEQEEIEKQQELEQNKETESLGKNIDFAAGDMDDDVFEPLPVSEFIQKQLKRE